MEDRPCLIRQMAPDVIAPLMPRFFHIPDQDGLAPGIEVRPFYACDLFLPVGGQQREANHLQHVDDLPAPYAHLSVVGENFIQLIERRAPVSFIAAGDDAKAA